MTDEEKTPVEGAVRRSSQGHKFDFVRCPKCDKDGDSKTCPVCGGGSRCTVESADEWRAQQVQAAVVKESERP